MRWANEVDKARMIGAMTIWNALDRDTAIAIAIEQLGEEGEKMLEPDSGAPPPLSPPDMAVIMDPEFMAADPNNSRFAQGVIGYVDDRIADAPINGWSSFDVEKVTCPVSVIHGEQDWIVPIEHAHHTSKIVQNAELRTYSEHGHLSIGIESVDVLIKLKDRAGI